MKPITITSLLNLHVKDFICVNCLSEDFDAFVSAQGQILFCENCISWMRVTAPQIRLKISEEHPTL